MQCWRKLASRPVTSTKHSRRVPLLAKTKLYTCTACAAHPVRRMIHVWTHVRIVERVMSRHGTKTQFISAHTGDTADARLCTLEAHIFSISCRLQ